MAQEDAELAALYASIEAAARQYQAAKAARAMVMAMAERHNGGAAARNATAPAAAASPRSAGPWASSDNPHPPRARSLGSHNKYTGAVTGPGRLASASVHSDGRRSLDITASADGGVSSVGRSSARSSGSFRNPFAADGPHGLWTPPGERSPAAGSRRSSFAAGPAGISRCSDSVGSSARAAGLPPQSGSSTPFRRCVRAVRHL